MQKKTTSVAARRAWNFLRLALLWARKGGIFKNRLMMDLRLFPKFIKTLRNSTHHHRQRQRQRGALHYGDRELSFDNTPVIHVKMHRPSSLRFKMPNIPCINPQVVDFDRCDDDDYYPDSYHFKDDVVSSKSFLNEEEEDEEEDDGSSSSCCSCDVCEQVNNNDEEEEAAAACDEEIDLKAEQFIAKFYEQIKLQRQISYLQYNDMINRGVI